MEGITEKQCFMLKVNLIFTPKYGLRKDVLIYYLGDIG